MKKWIVVVIIILILIINPSKSNTFNRQNIKELNKIELYKDAKYIKYRDNIVVGQKNELIAVNPSGEIKTLIKLSKDIENFEIDSNSYIDIIDKKNNTVTSINSDGKTIFTDQVYQETLMYKSINKNIFMSVYKHKGKEYIEIQDIEKNLIKEIEYSSKITHLESLDNRFIVVDLNTDKGIYSSISLYDTNGQLIKRCEFDNIIMDVVCDNKNIYIVFENRIEILEKELVKKNSINIDGIKNIQPSENGQVFIVDNNNKAICTDGNKQKTIKLKPEVDKIEPLGSQYITYSKSNIYNKENKEVVKFDEEILDIINLNEDTVGIHVDGFMKVLKLK